MSVQRREVEQCHLGSRKVRARQRTYCMTSLKDNNRGFKERYNQANIQSTQDLCESRGGRPGLSVPDSPYDGLSGRGPALNLNY